MSDVGRDQGQARAASPDDPEVAPHERPPFDPDAEEMRRLGYALVDALVEHERTLPEQRVARRATGAELAALVDEPLPTTGRGAEDSLRFFFERVVPDLTKVNHPRFFAYIPSPGSFYGLLGAMLAAGTNPFVGSWLGGATLAALELTTLRWIAEAVGYPGDAAGIFTSGGSMANLTAIAAARSRHGGETLERGVLYVSAQGHASVEKAARILGYPDSAISRVEVDRGYRLAVEALASRVAADRARGRIPFFVSANAGTTNTGAVDPLPEIAETCRREQLWFHVDGAYGGFAAIAPSGRLRLAGMEAADSLTLDPHKWLYTPMGVGCVLLRDRDALTRAFSTAGDYLKDIPPDEVNFFDRGPELSRPGRALMVWMLLRSAGLDAVRQQIESDLALARYAHELLAKAPAFEVVSPPELSILAFRHRRRTGESTAERARRDAELVERCLADGYLMLSSTTLDGENVLRFVVQNHRTDAGELRRSVAHLEALSATIS